MANLTTTISVQMDTKDKDQATEILQKLGVSMSGLINMTIKQLIMRKAIPFEVKLSKESDDDYLLKYFSQEDLDKTVKELEDMKKYPERYKSYTNVDKLFNSLDNDE